MNEKPPPLPPRKDTIFHQAATACIASPILSIGLNFLLSAGGSTAVSADTRVAVLTRAGIFTVIMLIGVACGILALCGIPRHGTSRILGRALSGLLIYALLAAIAVPNFLKARTQAIKARDARAAITNEAAAVEKAMQKEFKQNGELTNNLDRMKKMRKIMDDASKNVTGDDAAILHANSQILAQIQFGAQEFEDQTAKLRRARAIAFDTVTEKVQLAERRKAVLDFMAANERFKALFVDVGKLYRSELVKHGMSAPNVEAAMKGFHLTTSPRYSVIVRIREQDDIAAQNMLGLIKLMEEKWGSWKIAADKPEILFENESDRESYNRLLDGINRAGETQIALQKQMLETK